MIRRTNTASGAYLLRRAMTLANTIHGKNGKRREVTDGFIVEGDKINGRERATVLDLPWAIQLVGVVSLPLPDTGDVRYYVRGQLMLPNRDTFTEYAPEGQDVASYQVGAHTIRFLLGSAATTDDWLGRFEAVVQLGTGLLVTNITTTKFMSQVRCTADSTSDNRVVARVDAVRGLGYPVGGAAPDTPLEFYGLQIGGSFIEGQVGGGWVTIPTVDAAGRDRYNQFDYIPANHRFVLTSFIDAVPISAEPNLVTYRVFAHVMKQLGAADPVGERALYFLDVRVDTREGDLQVTTSNRVLFRPALSTEPLRRPVDSTSGYYLPNGFFPPAFCENGAAFLTARTNELVGYSNHNYWGLLVTVDRQTIEVSIPQERRPARSIFSDDPSTVGFFGTGLVDGKCYFVNPFHGDNSMMVVDADTGAVTHLAAPYWYPVAMFDTGIPRGEAGWRLNHPYSPAAHIGSGKVVFPVELGIDGPVTVGVWNTRTGTVAEGGQLTNEDDQPLLGSDVARINRGAAVCCVQLETEDGDDAIILLTGAGYISVPGGFTYISYDSGSTWRPVSETIGGSRGINVQGSALQTAIPGSLRGKI